MSEQDIMYAKEKELRSLEAKVDTLERENERLREMCGENIQDHKEFDKKIHDIDKAQGVTANSISTLLSSFNELRIDIKTRDNDTLRSYNSFKWALVLSILTTAIGFVVNLAN